MLYQVEEVDMRIHCSRFERFLASWTVGLWRTIAATLAVIMCTGILKFMEKHCVA